jgi:hypothetical protein
MNKCNEQLRTENNAGGRLRTNDLLSLPLPLQCNFVEDAHQSKRLFLGSFIDHI